jgi:hypothetical protein
MDFRPSSAGCKQEVRPPPCPVCWGPCWWDGWRLVAQMLAGGDGLVVRLVEVPRHRARCQDPTCPGRSWTIYEAGGYPCRTFVVAVAALALAALAVEVGATLASVARRCQCDPRTVGRWKQWVGGLCDPATLSRLCSRLEPDGFPPPRPKGMLLAGFLVLLLEHLARLFREQGVPLEPGPGLAAILRQQFDRFRTVSWLTRASPPLPVEGALAGV